MRWSVFRTRLPTNPLRIAFGVATIVKQDVACPACPVVRRNIVRKLYSSMTMFPLEALHWGQGIQHVAHTSVVPVDRLRRSSQRRLWTVAGVDVRPL